MISEESKKKVEELIGEIEVFRIPNETEFKEETMNIDIFRFNPKSIAQQMALFLGYFEKIILLFYFILFTKR